MHTIFGALWLWPVALSILNFQFFKDSLSVLPTPASSNGRICRIFDIQIFGSLRLARLFSTVGQSKMFDPFFGRSES